MKEKILTLITNAQLPELYALLPNDEITKRLIEEAVRSNNEKHILNMLYHHISEHYMDNENGDALVWDTEMRQMIMKISECIDNDNMIEAFKLLPDKHILKIEHARISSSDLDSKAMDDLSELADILKGYTKNMKELYFK